MSKEQKEHFKTLKELKDSELLPDNQKSILEAYEVNIKAQQAKQKRKRERTTNDQSIQPKQSMIKISNEGTSTVRAVSSEINKPVEKTLDVPKKSS